VSLSAHVTRHVQVTAPSGLSVGGLQEINDAMKNITRVIAATMLALAFPMAVRTQDTLPLGGGGGMGRGDFNNDGIADLAVGVPDETRIRRTFDPDLFQFVVTNHPGAGAVNIIYGAQAGGLTQTGTQILDQGPIFAVSDNAHFGRALAAGRFRGPALGSDLAVGAPGVRRNNSPVGALYVFFSRPEGRLSTIPDQVFFADQFSTAGTSLGANPMDFPDDMTMTSGNFNGDDFTDLAVEVVNGGVAHANSRSAVLMLYGSASGFSRTNFTVLVVNDALAADPVFRPGCGVQRTCATSRGHIGLAAANLDDAPVDAGPRDELLIGSQSCREIDDNGQNVTGGPRGCVAIVPGTNDPALDPFGWSVLVSDVGGDGFGTSMAIGDFDGSGELDVAVGAPGAFVGAANQAGSVLVYFDPVDGQFPNTVLTQNTLGVNQVAETNDRFGSALAAGDFHGDGFSDLAVGAPGESTGNNVNHGAVTVFHGSANGLPSTTRPPLTMSLGSTGLLLVSNGAQFGSSLSAGNFGLTPEPDLMIGSPFFTIRNFAAPIGFGGPDIQGAGSVLAVYGLPQAGLTSVNMQLWMQNPGFNPCQGGPTACLRTSGVARTGNHFGASVH
jgi:FG-GAP repeat